MSGEHTAYGTPVRVCRLDELPEVGAAAADIDGRIVSLVRTADGAVHCIDDTCTHAEISLADARSEERRVGKGCRSRRSPYH